MTIGEYAEPGRIRCRRSWQSARCGYGYTGTLGVNGDCRWCPSRAMANNVFWQNRAFRVDIVGPGSGNQSQQNLIALTPR